MASMPEPPVPLSSATGFPGAAANNRALLACAVTSKGVAAAVAGQEISVLDVGFSQPLAIHSQDIG